MTRESSSTSQGLQRDSIQLPEGAYQALEQFRIHSSSEPETIGPLEPTRRPSTPEPTWMRRWKLPILLLIASILSMTWAGLTMWSPVEAIEAAVFDGSLFDVRRSILSNWFPGLIFSLALTAILGAHELGHYIATRLYGIRSTPPLFIPFPISPIGTCGAVILMDGRQADRKQIFDIGIAGPLAGLFFAIPVACAGLLIDLPMRSGGFASYTFGQPLIIQGLQSLLQENSAVTLTPPPKPPFEWMGLSQASVSGIQNIDMNPLLMAAWVGLLITGVNMIPISQLDGGHVIFGLLGTASHVFSKVAYFACIAYVVFGVLVFGQGLFVLMLILVSLMGIKHPPSRNDHVSLGAFRQVLGWVTLTLPLLCIPLRPVTMVG
ncbi:MAG: site-2 protease family protein [Planctomycetota bacterium]|jgi:membrane-associated protease RseP (regulator of RpoE activity)